MSGTATYSLPKTAAPKLEALVDQIIARPGDLIDLTAMEAAPETLDVKAVVESLPDSISEEDFVGILKLAMLTECATDSYAAVFQEGAETYDAPWLTRFNKEVWVPDEHAHATPYQFMLQSLGYTEEELQAEMRDTQERTYEHCCGISPVELSTYGTVQELLTDNWHGLIAKLLKPKAPYAAHCANLIKRRETLHTVWYRDMTAVMVEENPELISLVGKTLTNFQLPGTMLIPQYGGQALPWMQAMNMDFGHLAKELIRNFAESAGTVKRSGMLVVEMAIHRDYPIGPFPSRFVKAALNRLGGPGYGLLGEAMLQKVGLTIPSQKGPQDSGYRFYSGVYEKIRGRMRTFIANKIDVRTITGETGPATA
ncbi:MAG: hypothetical protein O3B65_01055 [Chloroflexi bacterium]|nr:hypothetical protein [Chloroflexota bacterium]